MSFLRSATPQWLLMHVLGDFCATSLSLEATFDVTMSLVGLLEAIDEWELAMFVGSRLRLDGRNSTETLTTAAWSEHYAAEWLVKELLHRHVVDLSASPDSLGFLTEYVNVPLEWIADAQGHAAMNNDCNYALAADHFAKAANFVEVWDVSRDLPYFGVDFVMFSLCFISCIACCTSIGYFRHCVRPPKSMYGLVLSFACICTSLSQYEFVSLDRR
jgi:hypothetical protein